MNSLRVERYPDNKVFVAGGNRLKFTFDKDGNPMSAETVDSDGEVRRFSPEKEWTPMPEELASLKGDWFSEEAGATYDNGKAAESSCRSLVRVK